MKELKDFLQEVKENEVLNRVGWIRSRQDVEDTITEVQRLVSEAYVAGINFQTSQTKVKNGRV